MNRSVWIPAIVVAVGVVALSIGLFLGIAAFLEIFHDFSLALGTILFLVVSAGAWLLARRTEREHEAANPDQASDGI